MSLAFNTFTASNIESILTNGKTVDELTSHANPFLIIKLGPPGSGKSSERTANIIRELGVDLSDAVVSDIDNVFASFRNFRNKTRRVRNKYRNVAFNQQFYNNLSKIHIESKKITNTTNNKPIIQHMNGVLSRAIRSRKNIVMESVIPITWVFEQFGKRLKSNNYNIHILYHTLDIPTLIERIHARGERLYALEDSYYRTFDPTQLTKVVEDLHQNLNTVLMPKYHADEIKGIHIL
jgi:hypothetical protein